MPKNQLALPPLSLFNPRNHQRCFGFELPMSDIVVRQSAIKWILSGHESHWYEIASVGPLRIIEAAVIRLTIQIPRTAEIWHWVIPAGLFSNPEDSRYDVGLPRKTLRYRPRTGRNVDDRLDFSKCPLPHPQ